MQLLLQAVNFVVLAFEFGLLGLELFAESFKVALVPVAMGAEPGAAGSGSDDAGVVVWARARPDMTNVAIAIIRKNLLFMDCYLLLGKMFRILDFL